MSQVGTEAQPLRVAIVGAGPAGFYAAEHLYKQKGLVVQLDMFDRLPTPFGLVRNGVAPDHQKIKSVTNVFDRVARQPGFRFFGNVELGKDISVEELRRFYHQILYSTGAQTDRSLNIPGADLQGSHSATEFVAWYNGHPDFRDLEFDLSAERVAVIGIGNVAVDVCRILCRTRSELAKTDIAEYALEALANSSVKEVYMLGRRGPAQGAYTSPELKELGEMEDAGVIVFPEEAELDELSHEAMAEADRGTMRKVEIIQEFAQRAPEGKSKRLYLRFLVSPTALHDDGLGQVGAMTIEHNELYKTEAGSLRPKGTGRTEELKVDLVFRSIGYRGVPLPGVPFNDSWGVILNEKGRVLQPETRRPLLGEYTAGWIKRGPSGVIGTNKPDALETVENMLADLEAGLILNPDHPHAEAAEALVRSHKPECFAYSDWERLNEIEVARGKELGRPRVKFTRVEDMIEAVLREKQARPEAGD
jgi:ferredoxin/flavodoxin---NADP+ reductase